MLYGSYNMNHIDLMESIPVWNCNLGPEILSKVMALSSNFQL